jgi:hypothetical protein
MVEATGLANNLIGYTWRHGAENNRHEGAGDNIE